MRHLISAFLGLTILTSAQTLSYSLLQPTAAAAPTERFDGTIAYDPQERRIFLFGGQDFSGPQNDLWTFSIANRTWTQLDPTGAKPAARFGHTLVYDSVRHRLILFGGQAGGFFSDTWAYEHREQYLASTRRRQRWTFASLRPFRHLRHRTRSRRDLARLHQLRPLR